MSNQPTPFLRRMLGYGAGLLTLEFLGGTLAFLWPRSARASAITNSGLGTLADIVAPAGRVRAG